MENLEKLVKRVSKVEHGFTDIKRAAEEIAAEQSPSAALKTAKALFKSPVHQARMLATFLFGHLAATSPESLKFMRQRVSRDEDWRVQEILAQAFDLYCKETGYERALPMIKSWLADENANVRRAATEGLRIWTARPYFRAHPELAITLLSALRADDSEYVRKSVGNAIRDISRKNKALVAAELKTWDHADKRVSQTYQLASKFLSAR